MSAPYVSDSVKTLLEEEAATELQLAVVVESGADDAVREGLEATDSTIDRVLPSGVFLVTAPSNAYKSVVELPGVQAIATRTEMEIME